MPRKPPLDYAGIIYPFTGRKRSSCTERVCHLRIGILWGLGIPCIKNDCLLFLFTIYVRALTHRGLSLIQWTLSWSFCRRRLIKYSTSAWSYPWMPVIQFLRAIRSDSDRRGNYHYGSRKGDIIKTIVDELTEFTPAVPSY